MTMRHALPLLALLVGVASVGTRAQPADSEEAARIREAVVVLDEIMKATDSAIPESILDKAAGIAVFPGTIRAGFIVGGMRGRGILSARTLQDPTAPAWAPPASWRRRWQPPGMAPLQYRRRSWRRSVHCWHGQWTWFPHIG
jgi:hypothetical protein